MEYYLDGSQMLTRASAHDYIARELKFPEYYGKNLDALYDCLTDIPDCTIIVTYSEYMDPAIKRVFTDASEHSSNLTVYFA